MANDKWWSSLDEDRRRHEQQEAEDRKKHRLLIRREELNLERSSQRGLWIAPMVRRHLGFNNRILAVDVLHIPPGGRCEAQRAPEGVIHVLSGRGQTLVDGRIIEWERGDTIHQKIGLWYKHINMDPEQPADLLRASVEPFADYLKPMKTEPKGDSYSDTPEDYVPPHPFGHESQPVESVGGEKWMSNVHLRRRERMASYHETHTKGRDIMRGTEVRMERSEHKGDFIVGISDQAHGFENQVIRMHLQQLPPLSHTETHRHSEAIIYILKGEGYTIMDGERLDWKAGDCMFVPQLAWHQHWNSSVNEVSQHLAITWIPLEERLLVYFRVENQRDGDFVDPGDQYVARLPWDR